MKPAAFEMACPQTVRDALALLADNPDSKLLAGGQSLVPVMNFRLATPSLLIDLNRIPTLASILLDRGMLRIGAMVRQSTLLESPIVARHAPLLVKAIPNIGHVQTRSRGTIGGSLAHADPSAELPLVVVTLDATITVQKRNTQRTVSARDFFVDAMTTDLAADELLTEIAIPVAPQNCRTAFREISRRHGDFAIVAVAAQASIDSFDVAVGGLEAVPRLCRSLRQVDARRYLSRDTIVELIRSELADAEPLSDLHGDGEFRRHLAAVLLEDVLNEVLA
jgi:carbon-monoxide dehydrogenase medium subunit/2-furoyl-CoA dehydrogenase FAD binding subunit